MSLIVVPELWVEWFNPDIPFVGSAFLHGMIAVRGEKFPIPFFSIKAGLVVLDVAVTPVKKEINPMDIEVAEAFIKNSSLPLQLTENDTLVAAGGIKDKYQFWQIQLGRAGLLGRS